MSTQPWARHFQRAWQERTADPDLPLWLRLVSAAYGNHRANGHAVFARGDLAIALGHPDVTTGEIFPVDRSNLRRAIQVAVKHQWLSPQSTTRCLVVPAHAVSGGLGSPAQECPQHARARGRR